MHRINPSFALAPALLALLLLAGCAMPHMVIEDDPLTPQEHINLGLSYEQNGEYDAAAQQYSKAAKFNPLGFLYLGNLNQSRGDQKEAIRYYRLVLEKLPDNPDANNNLAWVYYERGENLIEAEQLARKAVDQAPDNATYQDTLQRIQEARRGS